MANYANLLATIAANIYTNGNNEVTAAMVKSATDAMVASLGSGYQFMGVATPTSPGTAQTPDYKCFYIASTPGAYTYLGGLVVKDGEVAIFKYNGTWSKEVTCAATAAQVTELCQKVFKQTEESLLQDVIGGTLFGLAGYVDNAKRGSCKFTLTGRATIPAMTDGYQWILYKYVSDSEGEEIYGSNQSGARTVDFNGTYVITFRHVSGSTQLFWNDTDSEYVRNIKFIVFNSNTIEGRIDENVVKTTVLETNVATLNDNVSGYEDDETFAAEIGERIAGYYTDIVVGKSYKISFVSCDNDSEVNTIAVYAYNDSTNIGLLAEIALGESAEVTIPENTTRLYFFNSIYVTESTSAAFNIIGTWSVDYQLAELNEEVFPPESSVVFCDDIPTNILLEMYFPNITSSWKISRVKSSLDGTAILNILDNNGDAYVKTTLAGTVTPFYYKGEVIGYFVIAKVSTAYDKINASGYAVNVGNVTDLDKSPRIKEYLNRPKNLVLLGDSLFGYRTENWLLENLAQKTDMFIANGGFPGCRAAWRTADGSNDWDKMSLVEIVDAIVAQDFSAQLSAIANLGSSRAYFADRVASLKAVDFTKPTIVFIEYGNNDITGGSLLGNLWDKTATIAGYDKTKFIEAINYGLAKLMQTYPNVKVIVTTPCWRMLGGTVDPEGGTSGDPVAPYEYTNTAGITFYQYLDAIKENCDRCGVRLWDFFRMGGRCVFNWNEFSVDDSHFNMKGYEMLANALLEESNNL